MRTSSPCIYLICTSRPNLNQVLTHGNCQHLITYAKFNLNIVYLPSKKRYVIVFSEQERKFEIGK